MPIIKKNNIKYAEALKDQNGNIYYLSLNADPNTIPVRDNDSGIYIDKINDDLTSLLYFNSQTTYLIPGDVNNKKTTAFNFNLIHGVFQEVVLGASLQFGIETPNNPFKVHHLKLFINQDEVGNRVWTGINNTLIDLNGVSPTLILSTGPSRFDYLEFLWVNGRWRLINAIFNLQPF